MNAEKFLNTLGATGRRGVRRVNTARKALPEGNVRTTALVAVGTAGLWSVSTLGWLLTLATTTLAVVALGAVRMPGGEARAICHRLRVWPLWAETLGVHGVRPTHPKRTEGAIAVTLVLTAISYDKLKTLLPAIETGLRCRTGAATLTRSSHTHRATLTIRVGKPVRPAYLGPGPSVSKILLGHTTASDPVIVDGSAHWIIAGRSGSGKSWFVRIVLAAIAADPLCQMIGIDLKRGVELTPWRAAMLHVVGTKDGALQVLHAVHTEMLRRLDYMAEHGITLWQPTPDAPRLFVPIDEMAGLGRLLKTDKDAANLFSEIMEMARAAAIHLIMCVQRPDADNVPAAARANRQITVCLGTETPLEERIVLGDDATSTGWTAHKLSGAGQFYIRTATRRSPVICTALTVPDAMVPALALGKMPSEPIRKALPRRSRAAIVAAAVTAFFGLSSCTPARAATPDPGENCLAFYMRTHQRCEEVRRTTPPTSKDPAPADAPARKGTEVTTREVPVEPQTAPSATGATLPGIILIGGVITGAVLLRIRHMRKTPTVTSTPESEHEPMFADALPGEVLGRRTTYHQGSSAFMSSLRPEEPTVRLIKDNPPPADMSKDDKIKYAITMRLRRPPVSWRRIGRALGEDEATLRRWVKGAQEGAS